MLRKQLFTSWTSISLFFLVMVCQPLLAQADPLVGEKKSVVCSACHGSKGMSANPEWPHLAGQHASYLVKQLRDFKQSTRATALMGPLAANLSEQDMRDLADYYAHLSETMMGSKQSNPRGQALYQHGDTQQHITACITCHGPDGKGNAQAGFPYLRHQSLLYTMQQLHAFKSGQRQNDLNGIMHDICSHLSKDDIKALADYISAMD